MPAETRDIHALVEHLFRHKYGQVVATLTRFFGSGNLDLAESVAQEALLRACQTWPQTGVPENPGAWIIAVAKNHALDLVRREQRFRKLEPELIRWVEHKGAEGAHQPDPEAIDDQLRMIFICCHPKLSRKSQVSLTLKVVSGFSIPEIARALLSREEAVRKLILRAKQTIRTAHLPFDLPPREELAERTEVVLDVIYLIFNEGYSATSGDALVRGDLCNEAIRLTELLLLGALSGTPMRPTIQALLALELLHAARLPARTDASGDIVLLADQDRSLWDLQRIARGIKTLQESFTGDTLSTFHLQAQLAACHATAASYEESDWEQILRLYNRLMELEPGPVVALNRAVAVSMVHGPAAALQELTPLTKDSSLRNYHLLPATCADLYRRMKQYDRAVEHYRKALKLCQNEPERRYLQRRIRECSPRPN